MSARFPDVPDALGVPPVFRIPGVGDALAARGAGNPMRLTADAAPIAARASFGLWAIVTTQGALALEVDTIVSVEPSREFRISDFPVENGGFASYNKVATPGELRVTVIKSGTESTRREFLTAIERLIASVELLIIVTPERAYTERNLVQYSLTRAADHGVQMITVELQFIEVRQTARAQFAVDTGNAGAPVAAAATKEVSGADRINTGPVQTSAPTAAQTPSTPIMTDARQLSSAPVTRGPLEVVPARPEPSQTLSVTLDQMPVKLNIFQKRFGTYVDVLINDALIAGGVQVRNLTDIVRSKIDLPGNLAFFDTQGVQDAVYGGLGDRFVLLYESAIRP